MMLVSGTPTTLVGDALFIYLLEHTVKQILYTLVLLVLVTCCDARQGTSMV